MEQPVWNPNTGSFFVSVPSFAGDAAGGVVEIRTNGTIGSIYRFASMGIASCASAGLGLGASGNLMVGCANRNTQTVLLNPTAKGARAASSRHLRRSREATSCTTTRRPNFFVTGADAAGHRVFGVINDTSDSFLQSVLLPVADASNPHSIAVDPSTGDVFVPLAGNTPAVGGNTACASGCIAVFAPAVPEPTTLSLMLAGLSLMLGLARRRRR